MSDITEALEAWREATRALGSSVPWSQEWRAARSVERERHAIYAALVRSQRRAWDDIRRGDSALIDD